MTISSYDFFHNLIFYHKRVYLSELMSELQLVKKMDFSIDRYFGLMYKKWSENNRKKEQLQEIKKVLKASSLENL